MTEELIERSTTLLNKLNKAKDNLLKWKRAISYYGALPLKTNRGSSSSEHIIPFNEYKARAIAYYENLVEELQNEFDNL